MFKEAGAIGGLVMQLAYFRGVSEFRAFEWVSDSARLVSFMGAIRCESGLSQIGKALAHAQAEAAKHKVDALAFVGDAIERVYDSPDLLCGQARALGAAGTRCFMFQEFDDPEAKRVFSEVAAASGGAFAKFQPGAAKEFAAMLKAVAAFAAGGIKALEGRRDGASTLLLTQIKRSP
jgi:hypothetical protein